MLLRLRGDIAALAVILGCAGCGGTCDRKPDEDPTRFSDGVTDESAGVYETSPWEGPFLDFPAGRTYLLLHGLAGRPRIVNVYLAFERFPLPAPGSSRNDDHSNVAPSAGNQTLIEEVSDELIRIRNDTCSDAFLRVTASAPENPPAPDAPDAS